MTQERATMPTGSRTTVSLWLIGVGVVLGLWVGSYYIFANCLSYLPWADRGSIGEVLGAINALFTGLAFVAVVITLYLQSRELVSSRLSLEVQKFEAKYFQLVNIQNEIIKGIGNYMASDGQFIPINGRLRIVRLYDEYVQDYLKEYGADHLASPAELIKRSYKVFFDRNQPEIGHYFRHLYNIVAFVDRTEFLTFEQKRFYTKLIRAQMSSHEMLLLFYNCLSEKGITKFKALVERYSLLEHMPLDKLVPIILKLDHDHKSLYSPVAFKEDENVV